MSKRRGNNRQVGIPFEQQFHTVVILLVNCIFERVPPTIASEVSVGSQLSEKQIRALFYFFDSVFPGPENFGTL